MKKRKLLAEALGLDPAERIRLAQDIWESVSEVPAPEALTELQRNELDRRLDAIQHRPDESIPWRTVLAEIRGTK